MLIAIGTNKHRRGLTHLGVLAASGNKANENSQGRDEFDFSDHHLRHSVKGARVKFVRVELLFMFMKMN
jgi:hypothetical protein